ncbi:N-terminal Xaa-Pro-Lys N-methyltransferase 1 [Robiginitalea marina]|uniref:N-terminal Xaa-Pro-Lys N-methyltransferase 1 n=1 Tax=Robiginitalea marina TaxID=2954105 RepID=A0ABT1AZY9_9FLAO|nr:N-terminal Xaa-Pro-Lys N-methyltransferase 1 [Robiginitalea marina]MCO5725613.1 N-terminal Xaa-Pro-Lys N-methyltransferase 1 [Robiginitalea marina]
MKDLIIKMPRVTLVTRPIIFFCLVISIISCSALKTEGTEISDDGYKLINDFYTESRIPLYYKTVESPSWDQLIVYDSIFDKVSYPVKISDQDLKEILSKDDLIQIRSEIQHSSPVKIYPNFVKSLSLSRKKGNSIIISKPIILDSVALLRQIGELSVPIYIFKKNSKNAWEIQYTFYQKLILE